MNISLKHSTLGLSVAAALLSVTPFSVVAQNTSAPASTATPTQTKSSAPLSASKTGVAPSSHATVEYKDPEDMTTRYRPGNNKTTRVPEASSVGTLQATPSGTAAATDAKKHIANVKYGDRQAAAAGLDAGSKDAAKTETAPSPGPTTAKQDTSTTQDSTRVNKVDSFTVKQ